MVEQKKIQFFFKTLLTFRNHVLYLYVGGEPPGQSGLT